MVRAAIADNPHFNVSDIELHMPRPSYTIDTIKQLQVKYPQHEFRLIIGQDNLENFTRWKDYQTLVDVFGLLVYPRFGAKPSPLSAHPNVSIVEAPLVDISATFIRDRIRRNQSVKYLVHHEVEMLISARRYYQV
jgi:nicotinate-nucleotide adenylyltransferase